jgi:hypothetical protein
LQKLSTKVQKLEDNCTKLAKQLAESEKRAGLKDELLRNLEKEKEML